MFDEKLSVIIPAYNEGKRIYNNLAIIESVLKEAFKNFEIIPVNDGSKDDTMDEIRRAENDMEHVVAAGYEKNRGKGGAIREGVSKADGEYIAFLDADLDLAPDHLIRFMEKMLETNATAVIGSKLHKDSNVDYPFARRVMSVGYYMMLKVMFKLDIKDTQTGVKLFKSSRLKKVMEYATHTSFAYDIEILALINQFGGRIVEMPINLVFQRQSGWGRIKVADIIEVAKDTLSIHREVKKIGKVGYIF